ncbi:MAG: hypothetical protein GY854_09415 [Deltaproteobacteria bacterium]|nr:hypothetical protein [Deltaproteobacteria bacterium]
MSCVLRVSGVELVSEDLAEIDLEPDSTWKIGQNRGRGMVCEDSGAGYLVSDADFDQFDQQKIDAVRFLFENRDKIEQIMSLPGLEYAVLDFGIKQRDVAAQYERFEPELVKSAGELGLGIELSQYAITEE